MSQVRAHNFSVSLDGSGTGEGQSPDAPFDAGTRLHEWFFPTRTFRAMQGRPGGSTGIDDAFASAWAPGIGAEIMGRGKFGPHHGPWPDQQWNGWWGDNPPFHTPVFVLTHHPRPVPPDGRRHHVFHFLDASPATGRCAQARQEPPRAAATSASAGARPPSAQFLAAEDLVDHAPRRPRRRSSWAAASGCGTGWRGSSRPFPGRGR